MIGHHPNFNDHATKYFNGVIDDFRYYTRKLTAEEVHNLYAAGLNDLNLAVRTCDDKSCNTASNWMEFDYGNDMNGVLGNSVDLPAGRYVQYRAGFQHADSNYPIGYAYLSDVNLVYNRLPDVNVWRVDGFDVSQPLPFFSYSADGNLTIDFNVADWDNFNTPAMTVDINYHTSAMQGGGTNIVDNLVVDGNACTTNLIDGYELSGTDVNLVAYYKFDGWDGNAIGLIDHSGNENHGQYLNGADNNAAGKWDSNAGFFDGADDFVSLSEGLLEGYDEMTVCAWVYPRVRKFNGIISDQYNTSDDNFVRLVIRDNMRVDWGCKVNFDDSGLIQGGSLSVGLNRWSYVCGTYTGSETLIYVNGVRDSTTASGCSPFTNAVLPRIGTYWDGSSTFSFNGFIEEVKIYNRALSLGEIQADYNAWANAYYYSEVKDLNHWGKAKKLNWKAKFGSAQLRDLDRDANLVDGSVGRPPGLCDVLPPQLALPAAGVEVELYER